MFFELVEINQVRATEVLPVFNMMDRGIAKVIEWSLKGSSDLKWVVFQVVGFWDGADKGHNMIAMY